MVFILREALKSKVKTACSTAFGLGFPGAIKRFRVKLHGCSKAFGLGFRLGPSWNLKDFV